MPTRPPTDIDRASVRACLERALASYYHGPDLARNPLCELLRDAATGAPPDPADLRALLREALESLRPPEQTPMDDPVWLPYRVATLHYLQSQPRGLVCEELAISQATFYRHRRDALEAMADYLWRQQATRRPPPAGEQTRGDALNRAISAVSGRHRELLDLAALAEGVRAIVARMPGAFDSMLTLDVTRSGEPVYGDPMLLRQVILNLVTDALHLAPAQPLTLRLGVRAGGIWGRLEPFASLPDGAGSGLGVAQRLLEAVGGRLELQDIPAWVAFFLPSALPPLVICLDDDADASRLYSIYLTGKGYRVRGVTTADELRAAMENELPSVIVLDVLMPREDGWAILDELQRDACTSRIPVVICSVLQQPNLALAMGAAAVLTKPVTPEVLRRTLDEVLAGSGTAEPAS